MKRLLDIKSHYQRAKAFYMRYERILMPATLLGGFFVDYITFTSIQINVTFGILALYWLVTGLTIAFCNLYDAQILPPKFKYVRLFSPLILQFTFGALLSASLIFYWFSGAFSVSWPLVVVIALLMVSNDLFRKYFMRPLVQTTIYFFTTISLLSVMLPYLFNSLNFWLFVAAGIISLGLFTGFIILLSYANKETRAQRFPLFAWVFFVFAVMNILYFANIIPPIPLALREAGVYHSLKVSQGAYLMEGEPETFWERLFPGQALHIAPGQRVYLYTAIFAPSKLQTTIFHRWQHYDQTLKKWVNKDRLSFTIVGGRQEGYKGYSYRSNLEQGKWRIYVENERGQVLGKIGFTIEETLAHVNLVETTR